LLPELGKHLLFVPYRKDVAVIVAFNRNNLCNTLPPDRISGTDHAVFLVGLRVAFAVFVIEAFPIQFMMGAVDVRQLMQEDMKQLNRMVGYVCAEQDAVLAAVVHPDKGGCSKIEVTFLPIPVLQPVREILSAELLKDFFLIIS